jgi:hypothetical protein
MDTMRILFHGNSGDASFMSKFYARKRGEAIQLELGMNLGWTQWSTKGIIRHIW